MENLTHIEKIDKDKICGLVHIETLIKENYPQDSGNTKTHNEVISESSLDEVTALLKPSDLILIAGRPAKGKTALCLNIATEIALKQKLPVAIFSLEMSKEQITQRMIYSEAKIYNYDLRTENIPKEKEEIFQSTINKLSNAPIYIDDSPELSILDIREKLLSLKFKYENLGAVIIDYFQLIETGNFDSRTEELERVSLDLKKLAKEFDVPIILVSQLSRHLEVRENKRPQLIDLKHIGDVVSIVDLVLFIYRDDYYNPESDKKNIAELIIAKNNNGDTGTIELFFDKEIIKFSQIDSLN